MGHPMGTAPEVLKERLRRRAREPGVSVGRLEILDDFLSVWEPVDELFGAEHQVLDTERSAEVLRHRLATWPAGLTQ